MKGSEFKFIPWLIFFFCALSSIPIWIYLELFWLAKIVGIAVTVVLIIVLRIWLFKLGKVAKPSRVALNTNDVFELKKMIPVLVKLSPNDQVSFQHRIGLIMGEVSLQNNDGHVIISNPKHLAMAISALLVTKYPESNAPFSAVLHSTRNEWHGEVFYFTKDFLDSQLVALTTQELQNALDS
jgi:hypothetical protein